MDLAYRFPLERPVGPAYCPFTNDALERAEEFNMRYPLNSESVKDPVRFARTWETRNPTEETARALVAQERGKKTLTLSQVFWSPHMGPCCNPDGMGLPILKRLCRLRA